MYIAAHKCVLLSFSLNCALYGRGNLFSLTHCIGRWLTGLWVTRGRLSRKSDQETPERESPTRTMSEMRSSRSVSLVQLSNLQHRVQRRHSLATLMTQQQRCRRRSELAYSLSSNPSQLTLGRGGGAPSACCKDFKQKGWHPISLWGVVDRAEWFLIAHTADCSTSVGVSWENLT